MPLTYSIAGADRTTSVRFESLRVQNTITSNADFAEMSLFLPAGSTWHPRAANEVIITTSTDSVKHFAGLIQDVTEEQVLLGALRYRLSCKDYTLLFDRIMVTQNYLSSGPVSSLLGSSIVGHIITNYTTGFSSTGLQTSGTVAEQRFDYVYPSDAIRQITDQLQWLFWIDYNKVVQFQSAGSYVAPVSDIDFDATSSGINWSNLVLTEQASNIKNRIVMQGYKKKNVTAMQSVFQGDGFTKFNLLGYEPSGISTGDMVADLNGVALSLYTDTVDGVPTTATVAGSSTKLYICYDNFGARMDYTPSSTETLTVTFFPMVEGGFQQDDPVAQADMASREGGDGVHMYQVNDPSLTNLSGSDNLAVSIGQKITARYGKPGLQGTFDSFTQGWRAGQSFTGTSTYRMGGFTKQLYVYSVTKTLVNHPGSTDTPLWRHQISMGESPLPI